jgi:hypothetical protein
MIGSCSGGSGIIQPGTVSGQTARWDGSQWVPSSILRNDGSQIAINRAPVSGDAFTIKGVNAAGKPLVIQNNAGTQIWNISDGGTVGVNGSHSAFSYQLSGWTVLNVPASAYKIGPDANFTTGELYASNVKQIDISTARTLFSKPVGFTSNALVGTAVAGYVEYNGTEWYGTDAGLSQRIFLRAENVQPNYTLTGGALRRDLTTVVDAATAIEAINAIVSDLITIKAFQ